MEFPTIFTQKQKIICGKRLKCDGHRQGDEKNRLLCIRHRVQTIIFMYIIR